MDNYQGNFRVHNGVGELMRVTQGGVLTAPGQIGAPSLCIGADCRSSWPAGGASSVVDTAENVRIVRGEITSTGAVYGAGAGFNCSLTCRLGVGVYSVNFNN